MPRTDSSSVAAVTILPSPPELVNAWKAWRKASKTLSKLRFIQSRIAELNRTQKSSETSENRFGLDFYKNDSYFSALHRMDPENDIYLEAIKERYFYARATSAEQSNSNGSVSWTDKLGPEQVAAYNIQMARVSQIFIVSILWPGI